MWWLLIVFASGAAVLWLSVFGYLLVLRVIAVWRSRRTARPAARPRIAVIVPTLDEDRFIGGKIADLLQAAYPRDRMSIVVADGGSQDATVATVEAAIRCGAPVRLARLDGVRGKSDQIARALRLVSEDFVVATDADARLDPSCIGELVDALAADPRTGVVGAVVRPDTPLVEERMHWWFVNRLWWLEGEALSAAGISGVCYAFRRSALGADLEPDARAEDVHLAAAICARGFRARLCPAARATELRVPRTAHEIVRFRRRRGSVYLEELLRRRPIGRAPAGWRVARSMRLWHFLVAPKAAVAILLAAVALLWTPHWLWPVVAVGAFVVPALVLVESARLAGGDPWWHTGVAAGRLLALTWIALLTLRRDRG